MIYHKMMAVLNYQSQHSDVTPSVGELHVKQDFNSSVKRSSETILQNMIKYIKEHGNPLSLNSLNEETDILHNIVTQEIASKEVRHDLLGFKRNSSNLYETFRQERFITKEKGIIDTIHKTNLKTFKSNKNSSSNIFKKQQNSQKEYAGVQKILDNAHIHEHDIKQLLKFDLIESN